MPHLIFFCYRYEFLHNCGNVVEERPNNSEVTTSSPPPPPPATPRIREDVRDQHCKTLRLALHVWLDQFPEDFRDPPNYPCLSQLEAFCQKIMPGSELDEKVIDFIAENYCVAIYIMLKYLSLKFHLKLLLGASKRNTHSSTSASPASIFFMFPASTRT